MKILHTSDWHLGQNFFTKSRKEEHQEFFKWLLKQIATHEINALIVAGDIFDTGTPPSYARELYNQFVVDINQLSCTLVVLGGNHDSVSTLNESKELLSCLNTHVIANTRSQACDQLIELDNAAGQVGAILCAIPFIRARDVMTSSAGESGIDKRNALGQAIKQHYQQIYSAAVSLREKKDIAVPIIATGHLTALGVSQSDSVRDIYIGSLDGFAADGFPPADYIALGHIHRPQIVAKSEHIRYSGSPIPMSFDELKTAKQVIVVEFEQARLKTITPLEIPRFQPMQALKGNLNAIEDQLKNQALFHPDKPLWLSIEVEIQDYLSDLQQRIATMTKDLNVEVLQLRRSRNRQQQSLAQKDQESLSELSPFEVFEKRIALETFEGQEEQARLQRIQVEFKKIVAEVVHQESKP